MPEELALEETRAVQAAVEAIRTTTQRGMVTNREFECGRVNPLGRVKVAFEGHKEAN